MPNWCENILSVTGDKEALARFRKETDCENGGFSFEKIIPTGSNATVDDHVEAWGTKWDLGGNYEITQDSDHCIEIAFATPWSPPDKVINELIRRYPELDFSLKYFEPGMQFAGSIEGKNGVASEYETKTFEEFKRYGVEIFGYAPEFFDEEDSLDFS